MPSSPLDLCLAHWKDVRAMTHKQGMTIPKGQFVTLYSTEWPTFNVTWLLKGTVDAGLIRVIEDTVFRPRAGHPGQIPYIVTWRSLIEDPPSWVKAFIPHQVKILTTEKKYPSGRGTLTPSVPPDLSGGKHCRRLLSSPSLYSHP